MAAKRDEKGAGRIVNSGCRTNFSVNTRCDALSTPVAEPLNGVVQTRWEVAVLHVGEQTAHPGLFGLRITHVARPWIHVFHEEFPAELFRQKVDELEQGVARPERQVHWSRVRHPPAD